MQVLDGKVIDGKAYGREIEAQVKEEVDRIKEKTGVTPRLATILVGQHPPSKLYVKLKHWACKRVGIDGEDHKLPRETTEEELLELIGELNGRDDVHGILVQLPLPEHIDERTIVSNLHPDKDVDGFHPRNMGRLAIGRPGLVPCTPRGITLALDAMDVDPQGKEVVVVGHSNVVGKPAALMMLNRDATTHVCHVYTKDLAEHTRRADILIVAAGVRNLIKRDMVKPGAIVFDVGINWVDGEVYGDVDFDAVREVASAISPVPGGVGPLTIAVLMRHTMMATKLQLGL